MTLYLEYSRRDSAAPPQRVAVDGEAYALRNSGYQLNILPGAWCYVPTGLTLELPRGVCGVIDLMPQPQREAACVMGGGAIIDRTTRGELHVPVINYGRGMFSIRENEVFARVLLFGVLGREVEWRRIGWDKEELT